MWQEIAIIVIGLYALFYIGKSIYKNVIRRSQTDKHPCCGCSGCSSCKKE